MQKILLKLIEGYSKFISPLFPKTCRFYPTCSAYAYEAIKNFGAFKGTYLAIHRILRCNPFFKGGFDPVKKK